VTDASAVNALLTGGGPETVVTLPDIAEAFGRTIRTVRRWTTDGGLDSRKIGRTRLVTRGDLADWLDRGGTGAPDPALAELIYNRRAVS
jgi:excisionase family DNA binding protein